MTAQLAVDGPATTIIDNFIAMLERDRVQRGRYVHPDPEPDAFGGVHPSVDGAPGDAEDIIERLGEAVKDNLRECLGDTGSLARPTRLEPETPSEPSPAFLSDLWARLQDTYPEADDARRELLRAPEDPNFAREFVLANSDPSEPRDDALTAAFGVGLCLGVLREREHATTHLFIWHDGTIYALSNPSDPDERGYFRGHYALLATPELVASDAEYVTNPSGERLIGGFFTNDGTLVSL